MENQIQRRNRLDLNTPAEKAIYDAIQEIEKVGSDPKLTDVVVMLGKAKDLLSDYVDSQQNNQLSEIDKLKAVILIQKQMISNLENANAELRKCL